jgi:hypothetical protein
MFFNIGSGPIVQKLLTPKILAEDLWYYVKIVLINKEKCVYFCENILNLCQFEFLIKEKIDDFQDSRVEGALFVYVGAFFLRTVKKLDFVFKVIYYLVEMGSTLLCNETHLFFNIPLLCLFFKYFDIFIEIFLICMCESDVRSNAVSRLTDQLKGLFEIFHLQIDKT